MNPIFAWIIAETMARTTVEMLTRRCPRWWHKQAVAFTRESGASFNLRLDNDLGEAGVI